MNIIDIKRRSMRIPSIAKTCFFATYVFLNFIRFYVKNCGYENFFRPWYPIFTELWAFQHKHPLKL